MHLVYEIVPSVYAQQMLGLPKFDTFYLFTFKIGPVCAAVASGFALVSSSLDR